MRSLRAGTSAVIRVWILVGALALAVFAGVQASAVEEQAQWENGPGSWGSYGDDWGAEDWYYDEYDSGAYDADAYWYGSDWDMYDEYYSGYYDDTWDENDWFYDRYDDAGDEGLFDV
jgi:hypothetical protein